MENYFEFYQLPISFHPDAARVKAKFYELSKVYHPDRYAQGDNTKMLEALTFAAHNNKAYKTLSNADATMAYILQLNGVIEAEEKYALPPAFLMEMMDINEGVSDYEMEPENNAARLQIESMVQGQFAAWELEAHKLTQRFENGEKDNNLLLQIKDMYYRKKYLLRIQERINKFAAR
jgi:molecular chaperone HscB